MFESLMFVATVSHQWNDMMCVVRTRRRACWSLWESQPLSVSPFHSLPSRLRSVHHIVIVKRLQYDTVLPYDSKYLVCDKKLTDGQLLNIKRNLL